MPDEWEIANQLNPNDANDGNKTSADGYTNLEIYLNSLVAEITLKQNEGGEQWSGQQTTGITPVKAAAQNSAIYNTAGQKVSENYKGLVIKNGRKFIQK